MIRRAEGNRITEAMGPREKSVIASALEIAGRHKLPQTARSYTAAEQAQGARKSWAFFGYGAAWLALIMPFGLAFGSNISTFDAAAAEQDLALGLTLAPWCFGFALLMAALTWWRRRAITARHAAGGYTDPGIIVEVSEQRLLIVSSKGREELNYEQAAGLITELLPGPGLVLEVMAGPIRLDNANMKFGRTTGACLIGRCVEAGTLPAP